MIVYPHAKINIGLQIKSKRSDGFHEVETLLYPVPLCDILEIKPADETGLYAYGLPIEGPSSENLVLKAYKILAADYALPPLQFHLYKQIPSGAGLGGGSSDAAYTLSMLNSYFQLGCSPSQLAGYAARLGSDCPGFLSYAPVLARGRGEILEAFALSLTPYYILVCKPEFGIATAQAYADVRPKLPSLSLQELLRLPVNQWKEAVVNDFEASLFPQHPLLAQVKAALYGAGALYASLSGSGSALYGIFADEGGRSTATQAIQCLSPSTSVLSIAWPTA
jgi:4-diphosphocytidyl-2C-methyl-D-erythritol kinase